MSGSTEHLDAITEAQAQKATSANALFSSASPAMLYARRASTCAGLVWGYYGGMVIIGSTPTAIANGTLTLTAASTCYVRKLDSTGVVSFVTSIPTSWPAPNGGYTPLYTVVVGASTVTSWVDVRAFSIGAGGSSFTGGTLTSAINYAPTVTIASSTTPAIGAAAGNYISITGTTTITGFDTIAAGAMRIVTFTGILQLTHHATSFILPTGANITTAAGDVAIFVSLGSGNWRCVAYMRASGAALASSSTPKVIQVAVSDQTTAITTGTAKITFRMPYAMTLTEVRASLNTTSSSGNPAIDINKTGVGSLLSTVITIDASEKTSTTAATPPVISTSALSDDDEITIDIDTAGTGAKGLIVTLIGT